MPSPVGSARQKSSRLELDGNFMHELALGSLKAQYSRSGGVISVQRRGALLIWGSLYTRCTPSMHVCIHIYKYIYTCVRALASMHIYSPARELIRAELIVARAQLIFKMSCQIELELVHLATELSLNEPFSSRASSRSRLICSPSHRETTFDG